MAGRIDSAYASLMAGYSLDGPVWTQLLENRAPLIAISYCFYAPSHSREGEENARRLRELTASPAGECREILEASGFVV